MKKSHTRVGDLAKQVRGVTYGKDDAWPAARIGYLPVLRAGNITEHGLTFDDLVYIPAERVSPQQRIRKDDVVIAASSGSLDVVGKAARALSDYEGGFGAFCKVLRPTPNVVDPGYFAHYFRTPEYRHRVSALAAGVNINNLRSEHLDDIQFPLPPMSEQRRIAEILDKADELRAKRRAALAQLDTLAQSIFLDMFGDPVSNARDWPIVRVTDYVACFEGGKSLEAEMGEGVLTRNRILKVSAVTRMEFLPEESKPVPDTYQPPPEHFVKRGDLLFSRANTTELVGAVAYVAKTPENLLLPDKLWRFIWRDPSKVEPLFVWALFQTPALRYEIGRRATGTSGSMKNISQEKVLGIQTILPPVDQQRSFARRLVALESLKQRSQANLAQLDELFASLQHCAFSGQL